ncbi:hypothetical protein JHK87_017296 [Glycine soja]|nr:hypothetical protein JHK87_017296 [Glycine soja]
MLGGGVRWLRSSERFKFMTTSLSTNAKTSYYSFCSSSANNIKNMIVDERHRQLENLDMVTAAKMLFSDPPKKRKFGFDFHLVQFFFACLPSVAVYLVAQYARYEMRKMEVDACDHLIPIHNLSIQFRALSKEWNRKGSRKKKKKRRKKKKKWNKILQKKRKKNLIPSLQRSTTDSASKKYVDEDHSGKHDILKSKPELREESKGSVATPNPSLQDPKGNQTGRAS